MKKTLLQTFIENIVKSLLTLLKVIIYSRFFLKKLKLKTSGECIILGNGPSLNDMINHSGNFMIGKDLFVVNFFCKTDLYQKLKPKYYVIASTNYWAKGMQDSNNEGRKIMFKELAEKTNWDMILFVPAFAKKHKEWKEDLKKNRHISIYYFNLVPIEGFKWLNYILFQLRLGMPRPHNVLIPSIKLAIDLNYSKVYLFGADHSWIKDVFVAEDNKVYLTQKHFYDEQSAKPEVMYYGPSTKVRTLAKILEKWMYTFESHIQLNHYATYKHVEIFNATTGSFIDAYPRIKL